jgi:cobalt-zinc-cadmium efflux system outer membrane protein
MKRTVATSGLLALALIAGLQGGPVSAQAPTIDTGSPESPGGTGSLLGPAPGAGGATSSPTGMFLGGRAGTGTPRVPATITVPGATDIQPPPVGMGRTISFSATPLPVYGSLALPAGGGTEGPPEGLTLDHAIERLLADNLDLRGKFYEIPQAEADILTASLRANPVFYADSQLVPYGQYSRSRPGGPTQYDVNVSIPLDVNNKRRYRMTSAGHAKRVVEAQYQDAVRLTIDNLYTAFVDVLAARETVLMARTSTEGYDKLLEPMRRRYEQKLIPLADVNRVQLQRDFALIGLQGAEETYRKTQHTLAALLNIRTDQAEDLEIRGVLNDRYPPPASADELTRLALEGRPDLIAYRIGIQRAEADVRLALANRYADIYWLVQPYTFQDLTYQGVKSATSFATGVTVPLPIRNRNQGTIERARLNATQTQIEMAALERSIVAEVRNADKDYRVTRDAVELVEKDLLPAAQQVLETVRLNYEKGQVDVVAYLNARREYNDVVRQYRDLLVQHRRSMLKLNTAVGRRLVP